MNLNLEQTLQVITLITLFGAVVGFFIKLGEYKNATNTAIENLQKSDNQREEKIKSLEEKFEITTKDLKNEIEEIKETNNQNSSRFEAILIEVKTKLELLISMTGMFKANGNDRKRNKN